LKRLVDVLIGLGGIWRSMGERPVLAACVALALVLLILDRLEVPAVDRVTALIADQAMPLVTLVREPVSWSRKSNLAKFNSCFWANNSKRKYSK